MDTIKKFYGSVQWKKCREAYIVSKNGICEECGRIGEEVHHRTKLTTTNLNDVKVSLDFSNLQLLCSECHKKHHRRARMEVVVKFDAWGRVIVK